MAAPLSKPPRDLSSSLFRKWLEAIQGIVKSLVPVSGTVALTDGITAPSAVTGRAVIFVDESDGDLKVIFSDGTTNTIVVDT